MVKPLDLSTCTWDLQLGLLFCKLASSVPPDSTCMGVPIFEYWWDLFHLACVQQIRKEVDDDDSWVKAKLFKMS